MPVIQKIIRPGMRFGKLVAVEIDATKHGAGRHYYWRCQCDCGGQCSYRSNALGSGLRVSCGCAKKGGARKRGQRVTGAHAPSNRPLIVVTRAKTGIKVNGYFIPRAEIIPLFRELITQK